VRQAVGVALFAAQQGLTYPTVKPLRGFGGAGVLEIIADYDGDTYRTVYTVRLQSAVYVLHVFQKKSTQGIATRKRDVDLIKRRLAWAEQLEAERVAKEDKS
jgi:phage-related protein